jgi:hypothetical protein
VTVSRDVPQSAPLAGSSQMTVWLTVTRALGGCAAIGPPTVV